MKKFKAFDKTNNCEINFSHEGDAKKAQKDGWIDGYEEYEYVEPELAPEQIKAVKAAKIDRQLIELEQKQIRPLTAIAMGAATDFDHEKLAELETEKAVLRQKRKALIQEE